MSLVRARRNSGRLIQEGGAHRGGAEGAPVLSTPAEGTKTRTFIIRPVRAPDIPQVIALDARITGLPKPEYWQDILARYSKNRIRERFFLVADESEAGAGAKIIGFIIGEIRAWEFGSGPCGWIFALSVDPDMRLHGVGEALFESIAAEFKKAGVSKMRTMVARDNRLHLLFFRGEGMMAGPYIQLEKDIG